jgi:membrane-bound serine protease (ClpP class)
MVLVVTLLLAGAILLLAETVLPGMIAGALGVLCLIGGVAVGYQEFGAATGNWILLGTLVELLFGFVLWLKYFPESRFARLYTSKGTVGDIGTERPELIAQSGVAHTALRPSGVAVIGGQRVDVVTEGALIERGTAVKVIAVEGARVVVRKI